MLDQVNTFTKRKRRAFATNAAMQGLVAIAVATLLPALSIAIGAVGRELAHRAAAEESASKYPVAYPAIDQVQVLADTLATVPSLDAEWRWAELDSRGACGTALLDARIVLLDPGMGCDLKATIRHEWAHIAQVHYYGGDTTPGGTVVSDLVDETGLPYVVEVQEVVADCVSVLLAAEVGDAPVLHSYLQRTGGCSPEQIGLARDIASHAGVTLTVGTASALGSVGAGVA